MLISKPKIRKHQHSQLVKKSTVPGHSFLAPRAAGLLLQPAQLLIPALLLLLGSLLIPALLLLAVHLPPCPNNFGLMPFTFRNQKVTIMIDNKCSFFNTFGKLFSLGLQNYDVKIFSMGILKVFQTGWFLLEFSSFTVEFWSMFSSLTVHVLTRFPKIARRKVSIFAILQAE